MMRRALDRLGAGLVWPLVVVGVTGLLVWFRYDASPETVQDRLAAADAWFAFARSLHLWSSRALLAAAIVHMAWTWWTVNPDRLRTRTYLFASVLIGTLGLSHWTGHVLRWDASARALRPPMDALFPPLGNVGPDSYLKILLIVHIIIAAGLAFATALLHLGTARGGAWAGTPQISRPAAKKAGIVVGAVLTGFILVLALAAPAPVAQSTTPWPFGPFARIGDVAGPVGFASAALATWVLVLSQPLLLGIAGMPAATRLLLALVFVASFFL